VKPALRRILRDEHTLQYGVHPLRAVILSGLARSVRQWIEGLDGTRDLERVLGAANAAGMDEVRARSLLDQLAAQGALHDAAAGPGPLRDLALAERDRLRPDLDALDLSSTAPDGGIGLLARRRAARVRVYGAGRVGAQIVALLAAGGVGHIRVIDPGVVRACDITPGGLTWPEVGLTREEGAVAVARRLTSGGRTSSDAEDIRDEEDGGPLSVPTPRSQPSARRNTANEAGQPSAARLPRPTPIPTVPAHDTAVQQAADRRHSAAQRAGRRGGTGVVPAIDQGRPDMRQTPGPGRSQTPPRPGQRRPGTSQTPGQPSVGTSDRPDPRHRETPRTPGQRRPDAMGTAGRKDVEVRPGAGSRKDRRIDGHEPVRPAVEVLAGGTYLGDRSDRPDLVIIAPVTPMDGVLVNELACLGIPHLLASAFEGHGTVGPLVLPGETACLHCLDLTRRDHDPAWPIVTARLGGYPPGEIACDTTLATLVAAEATGHALAHLDGRESAVTNGTMEVTPDWRWKSRSWCVHPQCRCMRNNPYQLRMVMSPHRD
jgi:hypothetical protein